MPCNPHSEEPSRPPLELPRAGVRASAVKTLYAAVSEGMTPEQALSFARGQKMAFLKDPALTQWIVAVLSRWGVGEASPHGVSLSPRSRDRNGGN